MVREMRVLERVTKQIVAHAEHKYIHTTPSSYAASRCCHRMWRQGDKETGLLVALTLLCSAILWKLSLASFNRTNLTHMCLAHTFSLDLGIRPEGLTRVTSVARSLQMKESRATLLVYTVLGSINDRGSPVHERIPLWWRVSGVRIRVLFDIDYQPGSAARDQN